MFLSPIISKQAHEYWPYFYKLVMYAMSTKWYTFKNCYYYYNYKNYSSNRKNTEVDNNNNNNNDHDQNKKLLWHCFDY